MKKLVFTAIAMVAFSGASIANTKELKEEVISSEEKITTVVKEVVILRSACGAAGDVAYAAVLACSGSIESAQTALWNTIYACNHPS